MRRALFVIAVISSAVLMAGGALAKGITGSATVVGEGLEEAITFNGEGHEDDGFMTFIGQTGVIGNGNYSLSSDWKKGPPTQELGPRYTITWALEQFEGPNVHFIQYLYPYADGGPVVHTPRSARILGGPIPTGWWEAPVVLRSHLESRGLPETNPVASVATGKSSSAAAETSSALPFVLVAVVIASLLAIGVIVARGRPRPAKAS
jgi:hypothetical protein